MKILIVDDHPVTIAGCISIFTQDGRHTLYKAGDAEEGFNAYLKHKPDICIVDISLPDQSGFDLTKRILEINKKAKIIIFTMSGGSVFVERAMRLGAKGYVTKSDDPNALLEAAKFVYSGKTFFQSPKAESVIINQERNANDPWGILNEREREIFKLIGQGLELREIARQKGLAYKTLANVCSIIKNKLEFQSTKELCQKALEYKNII